MLTAEQTAAYERDGFLVIEDFVTRETCRALQTRADDNWLQRPAELPLRSLVSCT